MHEPIALIDGDEVDLLTHKAYRRRRRFRNRAGDRCRVKRQYRRRCRRLAKLATKKGDQA